MLWDREKLTILYHKDGLTLQSIGDMYGVSRERIRQVMKRLGIATVSSKERGRDKRYKRKSKPRFKTLDEYLRHNAEHSKSVSSGTVRRYLPRVVRCSSCDREVWAISVHIHHLIYPARQLKDIRLLCPSCHKSLHCGKLTYARQIDVHNRFLDGCSAKQLAQEYQVSVTTVRNTVRKIASAGRSVREGRTRIRIADIRPRY